MADQKDSFGRAVVREKSGQISGVRVGNTKPVEVESEEDRNDRNELANAREWDRPAIEKRQAARRAAKAAASSSIESPVVLKPKE